MSRLTKRQKLFIEAYLRTFNGTQSAIEAGYSERSARSTASENLTKPNIATEIKRRITEKAMSADEVLLRLADQARLDVGPYVKTDDGGLSIDWDELKAAGLTHLVKAITPTRYGTKVEFHDPQAALVQLGRALGIFKDRLEIHDWRKEAREKGIDPDGLFDQLVQDACAALQEVDGDGSGGGVGESD